MLYSSVYTRVPEAIVSLIKGSMVVCFTLARRLITTGPPRCIIPKTGGLSFFNVPRPPWPLSRRRRPFRLLCFTISGCPLWPAVTYASSHSTSFDSVTVGFFLRSPHATESSSAAHHYYGAPLRVQFAHSPN